MLAVVFRRQILTFGRKVQPASESKLLDIADVVGYRYQDTPRADHIHEDVPTEGLMYGVYSGCSENYLIIAKPRAIVSTLCLSKVDGR